MPVTYEQLLEKANQVAKNLQVEEIEGKNIYRFDHLPQTLI